MTKLDQMKAMWGAGNYLGALRMVAKWPRLGADTTVIRKGWACATNPGFYRQLGQDPDMAVDVAYRAIAKRYALTPPPHLKPLVQAGETLDQALDRVYGPTP